ncbi:MAG TPA: glycosyltransferase family 4 protein [Candidatus Limnocylindrales bacterium]|nr:glycosyltransferase family 4 protein [Candidatus Limnocylindrales bacterium]
MNVVFLEASSGNVVGGSLTGMLELLRGIAERRGRDDGDGRSGIAPHVVLYENKSVIADLQARGIPVHVFDKRRLPKEHGLEANPTYARAKNVSAVAGALRTLRVTGTFLLETVPTALRLARLLRPIRPALVYVANGFRGNADAIVAARLLGVPCVVHAKGFDKLSYVERGLSRGVDLCISMTMAIEEHCRAGGMRPRQFAVVYDGLDLRAFQPRRPRQDVRDEFGIAADAELVGVVGNVQEWKGQRVLVEALELLRERRPRLVLMIVGGIHRSGLAYADAMKERIRQQGLESRVIWTGARPDVPDLLGAMDVVTHTSVRGEPFGRVIIEAMAVGRPIVATRAGGVPEFVRDGEDCVLTTPGDAGELSAVLDRLLSDAGLRQRLSNGALESAQRFALDKHVETITSLFEEVLARRTHAGNAAAVPGGAS